MDAKLVVSIIIPLVFLIGLLAIVITKKRCMKAEIIINILLNSVQVLSIFLAIIYLCLRDISVSEFFRKLLSLYFPLIYIVFGYFYSLYHAIPSLFLISLDITIIHAESEIKFFPYIFALCSLLFLFHLIIYILNAKPNYDIIILGYNRIHKFMLIIMMIIMISYDAALISLTSSKDLAANLIFYFFACFIENFIVFIFCFARSNVIYYIMKTLLITYCITAHIMTYFLNKTVFTILSPILACLCPLFCQMVFYLVAKAKKTSETSFQIDGDMYKVDWETETATLEKKNDLNDLIRDHININGKAIKISHFDLGSFKDYDLESFTIQNSLFVKFISELNIKTDIIYYYDPPKPRFCNNIKQVTLDFSFNQDSINEVVKSISSLKTLDITDRCKTYVLNYNKLYSKRHFGLSFCSRKSTHLTINASCININALSCCSCQLLTYVYFPASVKRIKNGAFKECKRLQRIAFQKNSKLTEIGSYAFFKTNLRSVKFPASLNIIDRFAFCSCDSLCKVVFPYDSNLKKLNFNSFDNNMILKIILPKNTEFFANEIGSFKMRMDSTKSGYDIIFL